MAKSNHSDTSSPTNPIKATTAESLAENPTLSFASAKEIGPLVIVRELGKGGFGTVSLATRRNGTQIAVKQALTEKTEVDLQQEASIMAALDTHPNIVSFISTTTLKRRFTLAMEYVDGKNLALYFIGDRQILRLSEKERLRIALDIAKGLQYLHERDKPIVHHDLKPGNILMAEGGATVVAKICDFGVAITLDSTSATADQRIGTRIYAAPETVLGRTPSTKIDIWAFGLILWQLVVMLAFDPGDVLNAKVLKEAPEAKTINKQLGLLFGHYLTSNKFRLFISITISSRLIHLLKQCLSIEPTDRPEASAIIETLSAEMEGTSPAPTMTPSPSPTTTIVATTRSSSILGYCSIISASDKTKDATEIPGAASAHAGAGAGAGAGGAPASSDWSASRSAASAPSTPSSFSSSD